MNLYTNKREAFIYASVCPETKQDRQADEKMKTISIFIVFDVEKFNFLWMNNIVHSWNEQTQHNSHTINLLGDICLYARTHRTTTNHSFEYT